MVRVGKTDEAFDVGVFDSDVPDFVTIAFPLIPSTVSVVVILISS